MTRAERHTQVCALKECGLTFDQIAARLGLAKSTVTDAYYDPTGEKARARKRRRFGHCVDCGVKVYNSGSEPHKRCIHCSTAHTKRLDRRRAAARRSRRKGRVWSDEAIVNLLRSVGDNGVLTIAAYEDYRREMPKGTMPSTATITNRFGSWNDAMTAAGHPRMRRGPYNGTLSRAGCLLAMEDCAAALGRVPSYRDYEKWARANSAPSGIRIKQVWGGWMVATEALLAELRGKTSDMADAA